ncbi:hypothetical protein OG352_13430 [Streptomyces sp. NBC_01485]|uniref:hypothetical protein n=1 Tax=Streptomyces sp. NBC_01485 TaxID=2903884 RepID=UPI002E2FAF05|nr:hypothetical protein [Streptomyces sp. NBC_01485]
MRTSTTPPPTPADRDQPPSDPGSYEPRIDDIAVDAGANKTGRVVDFVGSRVWLRPVGGGIEWNARPEDLRPATTAETLSKDVAAANARSRGECP